MSTKSASRGEFPKLVSDHILRDVDWEVVLSIVDRKGMTDELRGNGGASRPGFDRSFFLPHGVYFFHEARVDIRAFF